MHHVAVVETISQPREKVWEAFADFGNIYRFHPFN